MNLHNKCIEAVLNKLSDAVIGMDKSGRINQFNSMAEEITGYSFPEAEGMNCEDILGTHFCRKDCPTKEQCHEKKTCSRKLPISRKDGTTIPIESLRILLFDCDEKIIGWVEVFHDISKLKCLEYDLKHTEYKYRRLFESTKDMIFIISIGGRFLDINHAMVELLDYPDKEALFSLEYIQKIFIDPIHWNVFKKQMNMNGFVKDFEAGFKKIDGTRLHCSLSANAFRDDNNIIVGYEGIAKDITARMDSFRNLYKNHQELLLLNTIAVTMNSSQDLDTVLTTALRDVMKLLSLNIGAIFLINHEKGLFELKKHQGFPENYTYKDLPLEFHDTELMEFLLGEHNNLTPKSVYPSFKVSLNCVNFNKLIELSCFLITEKGKPSGFMAFQIDANKELILEDLHLLGSLGNFIGGAIANMNLIKIVQKHREELKNLTAQLFQSQETVLKRISRELHDETGSALIGINFNLETLEKITSKDDDAGKNLIGDIKGQINRTYQKMRRISHLLHPALLTDLGLEPALDSYMSQIARQSTMNITFKMIGFKGRVNPDIETLLYRFSQEAISNAIKYAEAKTFNLSIIKSYPSILFVAEDDGIGFDEDKNDPDRPALGLLSMRERTAIMGGEFSLRTEPGKGTRIRISIPINKDGQSTLLNQFDYSEEKHHEQTDDNRHSR